MSEEHEFTTEDGRKYTLARDLTDTSDGGVWEILRENGTKFANFSTWRVEAASFRDNDGVHYVINPLTADTNYSEAIEPPVIVAMAAHLNTDSQFEVGTDEHRYLSDLRAALLTYRNKAYDVERMAQRLKHPQKSVNYQRARRNYEWAQSTLENLGLNTTAMEMALELLRGKLSIREIRDAIAVLVDE